MTIKLPPTSNPSGSPPRAKPTITTTTTTTTVICIAFLLLTPFLSSSVTAARSSNKPTPKRNKLPHPIVILISSDGFRFGHQWKTNTPNIHRLINHGTSAELGLIPVFPTLTFPNHYSIVTGLYPASHGIVCNSFIDPQSGDVFTRGASHDPKWWLGEPLWETVAKHGKKAVASFWPGAEVKKGAWNCPVKFCPKYNKSVSFENRIDTLLSYFDDDLPDQIPVFMSMYLNEPDNQGHRVGPDGPEITAAVAKVDTTIGRLIKGLENRGVFEQVTIIMVGDHGMVGTCDQKLIFLDDLAPFIKIPSSWVQFYTPVLSIRPPAGQSSAEIVRKMNEVLMSGKVGNGDKLKMYLKEDLPSRLHYSGSDRITPIVGMVEEGYTVQQTNTNHMGCGGAHGYDNAFFSMRTIFIAHGPRFAKGKKIPSFENVEIYNLVTEILGIRGAPNNGTTSFPKSVLLRKQRN